MKHLIHLARQAAEQVVGQTTDARHVDTLDSGEEVFHVDCQASRVLATVSINPNGRKACVEWPSGTRGSNYKICDLQDLAPSSLTTTSEVSAVEE